MCTYVWDACEYTGVYTFVDLCSVCVYVNKKINKILFILTIQYILTKLKSTCTVYVLVYDFN